MQKPIKTTVREARNILADVSDAEIHPSTKEKPQPGASFKRHVMHIIHTALLQSGRLVARNHESKHVKWPLKGEKITTLGYGGEKVSYKVSDGATKSDTVVSVFHLDSLRKDALEVIREKKQKYDTYKKYFGNLVLPTQFTVVDNPWGEGGKPASIQPFIENAEQFGKLGEIEIRKRVDTDPNFAQQLQTLVDGYHAMLNDGLCPDFATSNLMVSGSSVVIFDTGLVFPSDKAEQMKDIHPNYQLIESLSSSVPA